MKKVLLFCVSVSLCVLAYAQEDNERYIDPKRRRNVPVQQEVIQAPSTTNSQYAAAEKITISGAVRNEYREFLAGVSVVEKGTSNVALTDVDGEYIIKAAADATLVFSFYGMETQVLPVNGLNNINVVMSKRLPYKSSFAGETTVREGFELQGDLAALAGSVETAGGINFAANYRFNPKLALGVGLGTYDTGIDYAWTSFYVNAVWNFTRAKFSPFAALEVGFCSYEYSGYSSNYSYDYYSDTGVHLGFGGGVQYSFNRRFALKGALKAVIDGEDVWFNIGLGVGAIFHF